MADLERAAEAVAALFRCADVNAELSKRTNHEIADLLIEHVWAYAEITSPLAVLLEQAIDRLRASPPPGVERGAAEPSAAAPEPDEYVIEDTRQRGDMALFWAPHRCGYTTIVEEAGLYSKDEAEKQERSRPTDRAWKLSEVAAVARPRVDRCKLAAMHHQRATPATSASPADAGKERAP